jgi:pimeloyl-ACP methyl ester carboxylesterase
MARYVLVSGAWLGGWCWQPIARRLREEGHDAYPVTLTGLGERVHLASPEVNLDTHITDVANLIDFEDLRDVVLVGHSYAGLVVRVRRTGSPSASRSWCTWTSGRPSTASP